MMSMFVPHQPTTVQRFGGKLEPSILAVDTSEPRLRFAANTGLQYASPIIRQPIKVPGMDGDGPTPPHGLRLREPCVSSHRRLRSLRRALSVRQPHERRNSIDDRSELAVKDVRLARLDSPHGAAPSCHHLAAWRPKGPLRRMTPFRNPREESTLCLSQAAARSRIRTRTLAVAVTPSQYQHSVRNDGTI